jgi:hypothetical protein
MRFNFAAGAFVLLSIMAVSPATADVTEIKANPQKAFKHRPSGIVIAAAAAGIPRTLVQEVDDKQLDIAAQFRSADGSEITTIYIFRKVSGDVPLWFDRIQRTVEARNEMANPTVAIPAAPFTPAGQPNVRGLRVVYVPGGPSWKSSAAALTETGEWYVAVRASSQSVTPDQLLVRLEQTFAALKWPREKATVSDAYQITECASGIPQGEDAESVQDEDSMILLSALSAGVGEALGKAGLVAPSRWCRDPYVTTGAGVYRLDGASDRFFIAFQDAGRGILVQPNGLAGLIAGAPANAPPTYMIEEIGIDRRAGFGSFKTLPGFAQAMWVAEHGTPLYSATTWGKEKTISISTNSK